MVKQAHALQPAKPSRSAPAYRIASNPKMGNQAAQRLLREGVIQAKLTVNQPGDRFEQEADRVAREVMRGPDRLLASGPPSIQRQCARCQAEERHFDVEEKHEDDKTIHRKEAEGLSPQPEGKIRQVLNEGSPLPQLARRFFEGRFGRDFSQVRIHTGTRAAESARSLNAKAYTHGHNIVFGSGEFAPQTTAGRTLLAHELTHTVQQGAAPEAPVIQRTIGDGHDLQAPRFAGNIQLEAAFDNELLIGKPGKGTVTNGLAVRLIQQSLLDQGYTLPGFGVDGIFGSETEAAIKRFQTDAGAVLIDGIVGPETMGLLDQHDTSLILTGVGPVAITGPVPSPRPAPAPGCDRRYTGVTFTLANQVATGANPAARIGISRVGGKDALVMQGTAPANYNPDVTINAPSNPKAQEFQVGFVSNLLTDTNDYTFSTGAKIHAVLPTPMKDGVALSSGQYDPVYVTQPSPQIVETFTGNGATVHLNWPDTPSDLAFVNLLDNAQCTGPFAAATMTKNRMRDTFRTWVAVRHMASGCVVPLHHIDWNLDWSATVLNLGPFGFFAVVTGSAINVTQPNGDGTPRFIQGGQVPNDFVAANTDRVCT